MRISVVSGLFLMLLFLVAGCASTPQSLEGVGAKYLEQCPDNLNPENGTQSVLLVSATSNSIAVNEFYLLLERDAGDKYLLMLNRPTFAMSTKDGHIGVRTFCYVAVPGKYRITKVFGILRASGPYGGSEKYVVYKHTREFDAPSNEIIYLGRYLLTDPRFKGKSAFGRWAEGMKEALTFSVFPGEMEINVSKELDEDLAWMREEYIQAKSEKVTDAGL